MGYLNSHQILLSRGRRESIVIKEYGVFMIDWWTFINWSGVKEQHISSDIFSISGLDMEYRIWVMVLALTKGVEKPPFL
jgi:hypothetical protein